MGNALRFGLMGMAKGALESANNIALNLAAEAKTERLQRARMAEEAYLRGEERKYQDDREQQRFNRERDAKKEDTATAVELDQVRYERDRKDKQADDAANRRQQLEVASMYSGGRGESEGESRVIELADGSQKDLAPGEPIPEGARVVAIGGRFAPARTRERQPRGGKDDKPAPADAPTPSEAAPAARDSAAKPGASKDNPLDAQASATRPPSGTWVRLPSGAIVQVP